jgi:hypothetical protein
MFAVSTGVESFQNPRDIGPLYPFPDIEWLFVAVGILLWLLWHVAQIRSETRENKEARELYEDISLERAMFHGGSALIATDEEWAAATASRPTTPTGEPPAHRPERPPRPPTA